MRKTTFFLFLIIGIIIASCIKETYDMSRLSERMRINPSLVVSAARGSVTLADIVEPNDTIQFDDENLLKLWIRQDSVVDIRLDSLIDFSETFTFSESYPIGNVGLADNSTLYSLSLDELSLSFDAALRSQLILLDDGSPHNFPSLPSVNVGDMTFSAFANFEYAVFSAGQLNIKVSNEFTTSITGLTIAIRNGDDNSPVGTDVDIPLIAAGSYYIATIDLTGKRVYKNIIADVTFLGSPGTTNPVLISMNDNIVFEVSGTGMEVSSGRIIVPSQFLSEVGDEEMVSFDPGDDMEITELMLNAGSIEYSIESQVDVRAELAITLPSVTRSGTPFSETIIVNPSSISTGSFPADNLLALLNTNPAQPYNSLPAQYLVSISSEASMIDFSSLDLITFEASISGLDINYVKGFFGQMSESIEPDTIDLEIDDILEKISGEFHISDPKLTLDYSNSFGLPVQISLEAKGKKDDLTVDLDLSPFVLSYPVYPETDRDDFFTVDRNNSSIDNLLSLPPKSIILSGGVLLNPAGNEGDRSNLIYGTSRFIASVEAEVPMDFWINNLEFADTLDNFMRPDEESDDGFKPEDLNYIRLDLTVENGFPLGVSVSIILHDSLSVQNLYTLDVPDIIEPAPVNSSGRVTAPLEKVSQIVLEKSFFEAARNADKMIIVFTLNTTGSGTQSVKIYSDYSISFSAGVVVKPDVILN